jgi:hypothetical protein
MKVNRLLRLVAVCLCLCLCLPLAACSKYRVEMSNEQQSRTVLSLNGYDVPFEVLYFFYHSSVSETHAEKLSDALRDTAELYAIFTVLSARGVDPFGEEMNARLAFGLYALLNSTIYDRYVSIVSKSKQINAKEMRSLPLPPKNLIENMGMRLMAVKQTSVAACDGIVNPTLHIKEK